MQRRDMPHAFKRRGFEQPRSGRCERPNSGKAATYGVSQLFGANAIVRCVLERRAARTITFILPDDESGAPSRPTVVLPREHEARRTFFRWQTNFLFSSR